MLTGPVDVTEKVLAKAKMPLDDIDLIEVNEAFAAVVLRYCQAFDLDAAKVNVNGGAIAMGHPLGATGAMILGTVTQVGRGLPEKRRMRRPRPSACHDLHQFQARYRCRRHRAYHLGRARPFDECHRSQTPR